MNDFLSWCRHLLDLTSLHPPSFYGNDFSTCSTHFSLSGKAPTKRSAVLRALLGSPNKNESGCAKCVQNRLCTCALAHTDYVRTTRPIDHAENGVFHCSSVKKRTVYPGDVRPEGNDR